MQQFCRNAICISYYNKKYRLEMKIFCTWWKKGIFIFRPYIFCFVMNRPFTILHHLSWDLEITRLIVVLTNVLSIYRLNQLEVFYLVFCMYCCKNKPAFFFVPPRLNISQNENCLSVSKRALVSGGTQAASCRCQNFFFEMLIQN